MSSSDLRPRLSMAEVFGPGHVLAPRVHDEAADWLPSDASYLDGLTGGQLSIAGDMPVVCSAGSITSTAEDLLSSAGLALPAKVFPFPAGRGLDAIAQALNSNSRLVLQHVFPDHSPFAGHCWVPQRLLRDLNNKANLGKFVASSAVPRRRIVDRGVVSDERRVSAPIVIKVVTGQSSAGGCGVMICRSRDDLAKAREKFAVAEQVVVEELLEVSRSPCLNFAVLADGEVVYLGHADQDVAPDGTFRGNWITFGETLPAEVIGPAMKAVSRAAECGYRGFAGVDLVITPAGKVYVVDLNFRLNASTPAVLLAPALMRRLGGGVARFRSFAGSSSAADLSKVLAPLVRDQRLVPLSVFDPLAAGYSTGATVSQLLLCGESSTEIIATENALARAGIG